MTVTYTIDNTEVLDSTWSQQTVTFTDGTNTVTKIYKVHHLVTTEQQTNKYEEITNLLETEVWSS